MLKITTVLMSGIVIVSLVLARPSEPAAAVRESIGLRRPVALALIDTGKTLLVANRDSGTVAIIDIENRQVVSETRVGRRLSDLAVSANGARILVADEEAGEIALLAYRENTLREVARVQVGMTPVSVRAGADGVVTVACLWPHRLSVLDLAALEKSGKPNIAHVDLSFAPRQQLRVPGTSKVIVGDAFGDRLAVVDVHSRKVESERSLTLHGIRGMAIDRAGKSLLLTQQMLNARGHTTKNEIQTSNLITNNVRKLSLGAVLDPRGDVVSTDRLYALGDVERGAGDPAEIAEDPDGQVLVTLAGVNELAIGRPDQVLWTRLPVGRRPTALAVDPVRRRAYVANTFDDSISVVDLKAHKVIANISLGKPAELKAEERGEILFHDARLSFESWMSCNSCHPGGHTNGRLNDNFSDGSFGTPKRVLSLLGVKDTGPWAWDGKMPDLETQVRMSLKSTMQGGNPVEEQVRDLTAFLRTLPPPPSLTKARGTLEAEAVKRGQKVFSRQKCATCHTPPAYTSAKTFDVGLRDEAGLTHFSPPSLRGLSQGGPYFHDSRAATPEEVFTRFRHQISSDLPAADIADLLHFLRSL